MAIVEGGFYSPRPSFGKKYSEQVDDLRYNSENVYPIVINSDQDYDSNTNTRVLAGFKFGKLNLRNKYKISYDSVNDVFKFEKNTGTEASPTWVSIAEFGTDDRVTITGTGGLYVNSGVYGVQHPANPTIKESTSQNPLSFSNVQTLTVESNDFYLKADSSGQPVFYSQNSTLGKSQIFSFNTPATTWTISHNFGITPLIVQVYDSNYNMIIPDNIDVSNSSQAVVTFYQAQAGYAMVASGALGVRTIDLAIPTAPPYTVSNVTADRSFDANATTIDEIADVLGTLIQDLQAKGILE